MCGRHLKESAMWWWRQTLIRCTKRLIWPCWIDFCDWLLITTLPITWQQKTTLSSITRCASDHLHNFTLQTPCWGEKSNMYCTSHKETLRKYSKIFSKLLVLSRLYSVPVMLMIFSMDLWLFPYNCFKALVHIWRVFDPRFSYSALVISLYPGSSFLTMQAWRNEWPWKDPIWSTKMSDFRLNCACPAFKWMVNELLGILLPAICIVFQTDQNRFWNETFKSHLFHQACTARDEDSRYETGLVLAIRSQQINIIVTATYSSACWCLLQNVLEFLIIGFLVSMSLTVLLLT